jgi:hypothetical protein
VSEVKNLKGRYRCSLCTPCTICKLDFRANVIDVHTNAQLHVLYRWHPKFLGAQYVFHHVVQPLLSQHEPTIDSTLHETAARVTSVLFGHVHAAMALVTTHAGSLLDAMRAFSERGQVRFFLRQGGMSCLPLLLVHCCGRAGSVEASSARERDRGGGGGLAKKKDAIDCSYPLQYSLQELPARLVEEHVD